MKELVAGFLYQYADLVWTVADMIDPLRARNVKEERNGRDNQPKNLTVQVPKRIPRQAVRKEHATAQSKGKGKWVALHRM